MQVDGRAEMRVDLRTLQIENLIACYMNHNTPYDLKQDIAYTVKKVEAETRAKLVKLIDDLYKTCV